MRPVSAALTACVRNNDIKRVYEPVIYNNWLFGWKKIQAAEQNMSNSKNSRETKTSFFFLNCAIVKKERQKCQIFLFLTEAEHRSADPPQTFQMSRVKTLNVCNVPSCPPERTKSNKQLLSRTTLQGFVYFLLTG